MNALERIAELKLLPVIRIADLSDAVPLADALIGGGLPAAGFIVSPGSNPAVIGYCTENGIPIVPGCVTPSEIETAMSLGIGTVKFFPAEVRTVMDSAD